MCLLIMGELTHVILIGWSFGKTSPETKSLILLLNRGGHLAPGKRENPEQMLVLQRV